MSDLSNKVKGATITLIGLAGVLCGAGSIYNNPHEIIAYAGLTASILCINCGTEYLKE